MSVRNQKAAIIVEGAAGLIVLVMVAVGFLLLLLNVGAAFYYKIKLTAVTTQAADYAASTALPSGAFWGHSIRDPQMRQNFGDGNVGAFATWKTDTQNYADAMLQQSGLPGLANGSSVTVSYNGAGNDDIFAVVSVTVYPLKLLGSSAIFPHALQFTDTATALSRHDQPPCFALIAPEVYAQTETTNFPKTVGAQYPKIAVYGYYPKGKANNMNVDDTTVLRAMNPPVRTINIGLPSSKDGIASDVILGPGMWYEGISVWLPEIQITNTYVHGTPVLDY